jgi:hypothetical protein
MAFRSAPCGCIYLFHSEKFVWLVDACDHDDAGVGLSPGLRPDHSFKTLSTVEDQTIERISKELTSLIAGGYRFREIQSALGLPRG